MSKLNLYRIFVLGLFAVFVLGLAPASHAQSKKDKKKAEELVKSADKAFAARNYQGAVTEYTQSLALVPNNAYAHYKKGFSHYFLKEHELAVSEFDVALRYGYKPFDIHRVRWAALLELKRVDEALADIQNVLKQEPSNEDFIQAMAKIHFEKGNYQDAVEAYQKVVLKKPNNADLYYFIAESKSKLGDFDGQGTAAETAIQKNTQFLAKSLLLLGSARHTQRRIPEAINAYKRAVLADPTLYDTYRLLAELYRSQNQLEEAIDISKAGLRQFANDGEIYIDLSWFYSLAGKKNEAIEAARSATLLLPRNHMGYTNLCRAYNDVGKPEAAIIECDRALKLAPKDGETHFYMGRAFAEMKKPAEAEKNYRLAVAGLEELTKNNPNYSDAFYLLGNAHASLGESEKAFEAYQACLALNPTFVNALFNIGIIYVGKADKEGAMKQYEALLALDTSSANDLKAAIDKLP